MFWFGKLKCDVALSSGSMTLMCVLWLFVKKVEKRKSGDNCVSALSAWSITLLCVPGLNMRINLQSNKTTLLQKYATPHSPPYLVPFSFISTPWRDEIHPTRTWRFPEGEDIASPGMVFVDALPGECIGKYHPKGQYWSILLSAPKPNTGLLYWFLKDLSERYKVKSTAHPFS